MLESFHFLRRAWLWALGSPLVFYVVALRSSPERQWKRLVAPHLLEHLKVGGRERTLLRPVHLVSLLTVLGVIALAGPAWERERSPFAEDTAPLVIALDVSLTMNAVDVQPTRLERAKQKSRDLLSARSGARTALIAYAGTAHTVLPLSDDAAIFETFLEALETSVMPVEGKSAARALLLAEELLAREQAGGSIVFLTDGVSADDVAPFVEHVESEDDAVLMLVLGTEEGGPIRSGEDGFVADAAGRRVLPRLDVSGLRRFADETGVFVASVTVDDADIRAVGRRVQSNLRAAQAEDETARWRDVGYYLSFPVAALGVFWFRRGWTTHIGLIAIVVLSGCHADVWLTPDQQGRRAFERGAFDVARDRFDDPMWRGSAAYRAGDFDGAIDAFARVDSAEAYFNAGNAYAQKRSYEEAVASYEVCLSLRPDWVEARDNLALVRSLIPAEPADEGLAEEGEPTFAADEIQFDDKADEGTEGEVEMSALTDDQLAEMWMRRLSASPAAFLRSRFAMESFEQARP